MSNKIIYGIQQIGVGVSNVHEAWKWYRVNFGMDIRIFEESAMAELMLPYTGGVPQSRHAVLALNLQGGGGFEIWQYTGRKPQKAEFELQVGDLGIFSAKIKCFDIAKTHHEFKHRGLNISELYEDPIQIAYFFVRDPFGNVFQMVESNECFKKEQKLTGGAYGAMIGVSNIEESLKVYTGILNYDKVIYDKTGTFEDLNYFEGGKGKFRRVLLTQDKQSEGGFSKLLGTSQIELIQSMDRIPKKIFQNRYWGDLGFIHLCYDIHGMDQLRTECAAKGFPFTVDSLNKNEVTFDMGEAAGHFAYIEDPDGTLIEFVETHKIPVLKKLGWYIDLRKRNPKKDLPSLLLKFLSVNRVKD